MIDLLLFLIYCVLVVIPFFKLLPKYGLSPFWSAVAPTGIGLIVLLWVMASRAEER